MTTDTLPRARTRKKRRDSHEEAARIIQGSTAELSPPSHIPLESCDWPFWENVTAEFARADWTEHQLELAAMLARTMANLEQQQRLLREEGFTIEREGQGGRTFMALNPRSGVVKDLSSTVLAQRRSLALHARARSGNNTSAAGQRDYGKSIERKLETDDDETGLLA